VSNCGQDKTEIVTYRTVYGCLFPRLFALFLRSWLSLTVDAIAPAAWRYWLQSVAHCRRDLSRRAPLNASTGDRFIFFPAHRDRDYVARATSGKQTIGTRDQHNAIALGLASNMAASDLDVSEIAVARHRPNVCAFSHSVPFAGVRQLGLSAVM
jgi:hypothetical protein